jgi:hypothetical protein
MIFLMLILHHEMFLLGMRKIVPSGVFAFDIVPLKPQVRPLSRVQCDLPTIFCDQYAGFLPVDADHGP